MFVVRNKKRCRPAFTLVEIIVSAVILSTSFAVVLSAFTYARGYIRHAQRRIVAANLIRGVSNYLYKELSRAGVGSDSLSTATHNFPFADDSAKSFEIDGVQSYEGVYSVTEDVLGYYQVTYNVTYPLEN